MMREAIPVVALGSAARHVLADPGEGRVLAVFVRAFYLEGRGGLICLGPISLGAGPLNLLCANWPPGEVAPGMPARLSGAEIRLAGGTVFSLAGAMDWRPRRPPEWHVAHLRRGLAALARAAARRAPRDGFGCLIPALVDGERRAAVDDTDSPLLRRAAAGASALARWLARDAAPQPPAQARALIGLGPGLTPSGDDLIAGALIALRAFSHPDAAEQLGAWALPLAATRTGAISRAHLAAAAAGEGAEPLHRALAAICAAAEVDLERELDAADRIGHCSGWDALAGIALAGAALAGKRPLSRPNLNYLLGNDD
jgi:Protein of unknown function (DUF2877)